MTIAQLNEFDRAAFTAALGHLFEHSPWVAEGAWERRPFRDAEQLHVALCVTMRTAPEKKQLDLIRAHPDLAGRLAQQNQLTAESTKEQASAGLNQLSADELADFQRLNAAYREKFGFPFVICARLNARASILHAMQQRLDHTAEKERAAALTEIGKIAWLRLADVLEQAPSTKIQAPGKNQ